MRAEVVERRQAVVSRLLALRDAGKLRSAMVRSAAESLDVSERSLWRWLTAGAYEPDWRIGWRTTEEAVEAFYRTGGRPTAAWRLLRDEGRRVPSHTAFCRALERDVSPAERAYARHGEDGRRRYSRRANGKLYAQPPPLSLPQLQTRVREFIDAYNHEHRHASLGGMTPAEKWATSATPLEVVEPERLRWMLMADETRKVEKDGIHFETVTFIAPALTGSAGGRSRSATCRTLAVDRGVHRGGDTAHLPSYVREHPHPPGRQR
jgi:hypothetical protein